MMEVLSLEESRRLMESMEPLFARRNINVETSFAISESPKQKVLLVHGPRQPYVLSQQHNIPEIQGNDEILVKVIAIGLNPVDWKGPEFNFGQPSFPWINGRDYVGVVVKSSQRPSRIAIGDIVTCPSTDYRDMRKAAFQEFVVATYSNCARVPRRIPAESCASLGVAFVAAAIALGVCFGIDFSSVAGNDVHGPDMLHLVRTLHADKLSSDVKEECLSKIARADRAKAGDWVAIWGASTATGLIALQLAKLAGLRVAAIADAEKYGGKLIEAGADLLVDRLDTDRAVKVLKGATGGTLRFGLDAVGKDTAQLLQSALSASKSKPSHLAGLTGLPEHIAGVVHHSVPIKIFHELPEAGEALMLWLERLLLSGSFVLPEIEVAAGGLDTVNAALQILKSGTNNGKRIIVPVHRELNASIVAA